GLAFHAKAGWRIVTGSGAIAAAIAALTLIKRLWRTDLPALVAFAALVLVAIFVRPWLLQRVSTKG
ncbi:MAG: hypothetical protein ABIP56_02380, partial [Dokdonella sp.]